MSILFNDARFNTRVHPRSRSRAGLWVSVVVHAVFAVALIVVPIRASEKPSPRLQSMKVFTLPPTEAVKLPSVPIVAPRILPRPIPPPVQVARIAEVPKPIAVAPIVAKPVQPAPATLLPAAAPAFERPVEPRAPERAPETGLFE